jgi:hypothetical protein
MAGFQAVHLVCEAVLDVLRDNVPAALADHEPDFQVYTASNFNQQPMSAGVSLFLYRITANPVMRTPAGRLNMNGQRTRSRLPLDLHFILTVWGQNASLQHALAGWLMRQLESAPVLPSALLNRREAMFRPDETVEVTLGDLDNENLFRLWETLAQNVYHLSVPYVARMVMLESDEVLDEGAPVQERQFEARKVGTTN